MIDSAYLVVVIAGMAGVTLALRALPFVASRWLAKHPVVHSLGEFLPLAIMTLLLLNSVVGTIADNPKGPWAEISSVALVAVLQWVLKNALLSILIGTGAYVALRNFV